VSTEALTPGLGEAIGSDLTSLGGYELARPTTGDELKSAYDLTRIGVARDWQSYDAPAIEELRYIADPVEASEVVRFPRPPRGGIPGIHSIPLDTLPKSPQLPAPGDETAAVRLGISPHGGSVKLTLAELNQHCLIVGLPGFGKTKTTHAILLQLWNDHGIPFLVLDPAKSDYGDIVPLLAIRDGVAPQHIVLSPEHMAFNPFVVPSGVGTAAHAARVIGAFDAALQLSSNYYFGYITLSRAIFQAYAKRPTGSFPTLSYVRSVLKNMIESELKEARTKSEVSASLLGRLEFMMLGPIGKSLMGDGNAGIDWRELLSRPSIVEFRGFPGPTERSLIFGLLIAGLSSYLESQGTAKELRHVTVLEEAHRVLSDRGAAEAEGVRLLAEAIAERRASGEGFIVVDQTPTVLHPVVRKICGSLVAHRLVEKDERQTIGASLLLDERQIDDLARLPVRRAVVYGAARPSSVVVEVDPVEVPSQSPADPKHTLTKGGMVPFEAKIVPRRTEGARHS
jgi:hypothetical protein